MRRLLYILLFVAIASAHAGDAIFVAGLNIDSVVATGAQWYISGEVRDYTAAGWTGFDVPTNALIVCESVYGDIDLYSIDTLLTATVHRISAYISYVSDTTNAPRSGGPSFGEAQVSVDIGGIPITAQNAPSGPAPYLRDGVTAAAFYTLGNGLADLETWQTGINTHTSQWSGSFSNVVFVTVEGTSNHTASAIDGAAHTLYVTNYCRTNYTASVGGGATNISDLADVQMTWIGQTDVTFAVVSPDGSYTINVARAISE